MNVYTVLKPMSIPGGIIKLSEEEAGKRMHALEAIGNGIYQVIAPVHFCAGDILETKQQLPVDSASLVKTHESQSKPDSDSEDGLEPDVTPANPDEPPSDELYSVTNLFEDIGESMGHATVDDTIMYLYEKFEVELQPDSEIDADLYDKLMEAHPGLLSAEEESE